MSMMMRNGTQDRLPWCRLKTLLTKSLYRRRTSRLLIGPRIRRPRIHLREIRSFVPNCNSLRTFSLPPLPRRSRPHLCPCIPTRIRSPLMTATNHSSFIPNTSDQCRPVNSTARLQLTIRQRSRTHLHLNLPRLMMAIRPLGPRRSPQTIPTY